MACALESVVSQLPPLAFNLLPLFSLLPLQPHPCLFPTSFPYLQPTPYLDPSDPPSCFDSRSPSLHFTSLPPDPIFPTETKNHFVPCPILPYPSNFTHTLHLTHTSTHYHALPLYPRSSRSPSLLVGRRRSWTWSKTRRTPSCQTSCCFSFLFLRRHRLRWTYRRRGVR